MRLTTFGQLFLAGVLLPALWLALIAKYAIIWLQIKQGKRTSQNLADEFEVCSSTDIVGIVQRGSREPARVIWVSQTCETLDQARLIYMGPLCRKSAECLFGYAIISAIWLGMYRLG